MTVVRCACLANPLGAQLGRGVRRPAFPTAAGARPLRSIAPNNVQALCPLADRARRSRVLPFVVLATIPVVAEGHSFVQPYTLPVPFGLYLYASAATLLLTFVVIAYFAGVPAVAVPLRAAAVKGATPTAILPAWTIRGLRGLALGCLVLTAIAGFVGTGNPDANLGVVLFWVSSPT